MLDAATFLPFFIVFKSSASMVPSFISLFILRFRAKQSWILCPKTLWEGQYSGSPTRSASCGRLESGNSMRFSSINPLNKSFTSSSGIKTSPFSFRDFGGPFIL